MAFMFPRQPQLGSLTLMPEQLQGTKPTPRPALTLDQLVGTWLGEAVTVFPDWQPEQTIPTQLSVGKLTHDRLEQTLRYGQGPPICTRGQHVGNRLKFNQGQQPVTVLLLDHGASATFPSSIQPGKPLFLEIGWLITPDLRQRLMRTYDPRGTLATMTLITEQRCC